MATWKKIIVSGSDAHLNNITSSANILANAFYISGSDNKLADVSGSNIRLGNSGSNLHISASSLVISASGGITASNIPQVTSPPFILAQTNNDELVKVPLGSIGSSGGSNTVNNNVIDNFTTCSDNTNINITVTELETAQVETLIGQILINDVGSNNTFTRPGGGTDTVSTNQILFVPNTGYVSGSVNAGDKVRIKNNASSVLGGSDANATFLIDSIFNPSSTDGGSSPFTSSVDTGIGSAMESFDDSNNRLKSQYLDYNAYHSASLNGSLSSDDIHEEGVAALPATKYRSQLVYHLYLVNEQTSSAVEICLAEDLSVNDITSSGDLFFEASESLSANGVVTESVHNIHYYGYEEGPGTGSLFITASHIKVSGSLDVNENINLGGNLTFDGFTFSDGNISVLSGSNTFGTSSLNTHEFTGSVTVSGSITLSETPAGGTKLFGTASRADSASIADSAISASYVNADNIDGQVGFPYSGSDFIGSAGTPDAAIITGSLILQSGISASGDITASGIISASGGFTGSLQGSASYAITSSFATSASHATTASYIDANNIDGEVGFPFTGSAHISGTLSLDQNGTSSISLSGITGDISSSGNITASNLVLSDNLTVHGDLIVSGTQTTIHTQDLIIEDRFVLIGSGSVSYANSDVGIIFDSGSDDGIGMGLFYDNSANRLAIGKNLTDHVLSNSASAYEVGRTNFPPENPLDMGIIGGNVMTIRSTGSIGAGQVQSIPNDTTDVQFGKGEMLIDEDDNIWMYVGS